MATPDTITDFVSGVDKIDLKAIDANTVVAGDQAFQLRPAVNDGYQDLVYHYDAVHNRTVIDLYVNGDGTPDAEIWLTGNIALQKGDFIL